MDYTFRKPVPDDAQAMLDYLSAVGSETDNLTFDGSVLMTLEEERTYLASCNKGRKFFMCAFDGDKCIATITSHASERPRLCHLGQVGVSVRKDYWGQGIATHLMQMLFDWARESGLSKLNLEVRADNERAISLYKKLGFVTEGFSTRMLFVNGIYADGVMMGKTLDPEEFSTERLVMRRVTDDDLEDFYAFASQPEVGPRAGWAPHKNIEESRRLLEEFKTHKHYFAITRKGEGRMIGSIEAMPRRDDKFPNSIKEIGFVLRKEDWGKGYMTEALKGMIKYCFTSLGCELLQCGYFEPNQASGSVQRKCGFITDGRVRMFARWIDGAPCDLICSSLSREQWEQSERSNER